MGSSSANSNFIEFNLIADEVIVFVSSQEGPVPLKEIEDHFSNMNFKIPVGRVVLQLVADRILYLTENRDVAVSKKRDL
jgi:hypothetical protein